MMYILAIVVIGQCLLLIAEEERFVVYIRLALFLCCYGVILQFLGI